MKEYTVRYDFPKNCVTFNYGTKNEFKGSIIDFYGDSIEEVSSIDISKCEFIDLSNVKKYTKLVWKKTSINHWSPVSREVIYLK